MKSPKNIRNDILEDLNLRAALKSGYAALGYLRYPIICYLLITWELHDNRQGMAPVLEMAMVAKLLMILIDSPMMWDVPKKIS